MVEVKSYLTTWRICWKAWVKFHLSNFCASFLRDYIENSLPSESRLSKEEENKFSLSYYRNSNFIPRVNVMNKYEDLYREKGKAS